MNKILSQAIRKAVSDFKPVVNPENNEKRPDLFSLNNDTELFQNVLPSKFIDQEIVT